MVKFSQLIYQRLPFKCLEECKHAMFTLPEEGFHIIQIYTDSKWLNVHHQCCNSGYSSLRSFECSDLPEVDEIVVAYKKDGNINFYLSEEIIKKMDGQVATI